MIIKDKKESKIKGKSKILVLGFIFFIALVGFFGLVEKASAETDPLGTCRLTVTTGTTVELIRTTNTECRAKTNYQSWKESTLAEYQAAVAANTAAGIDKDPIGTCLSVTGKIIGEMTEKKCKTENIGAYWTTNKPSSGSDDGTKTPFEQEVEKNECGIFKGSLYPGCFIQLFYGLFYVIPSWLLFVSAYFFNVLIKITLSSTLFTHPFVSEAWGVVRDLSNIFFILILLYIAVKIILDLAGHEAKKMIVKVIIIALLINFSMFFTQVIIDASNVLALVFYNKVSVCTNKNPTTGECRPYQATGYNDKDVAGGLVNAFNPTKLITKDYFNQAKTTIISVNGEEKIVPPTEIAPGILIGMLLISGVLMFFASYSLFVVGLSFMGRLIELFVLIIFSPFAFMSSTVPLLSGVEYLGWDAWFKRLLKVSFMAPIFMFFLYFIFMLIKADLFNGLKTASTTRMIESLLMIVLPALVILILLLKATEFAKKGSGVLGEKLMSGAKLLGGIALGAATGGTSLLATNAIGGGGGYVANKLASGANKLGDTKWGNRLGMNKLASGLTSVGAYAQKSSFDVRGIKIGGKTLASATGLNLGEARKGGITQARKEKVEERRKRAELLNVREDEGLKQNLNKAEMALQELLNRTTKDFEEIDRELEGWRKKKADSVTGSADNLAAAAEIKTLRARKAAIKDGSTGVTTTDENGNTVTIKDLEDKTIPDAKVAVENESRRRKVAFANRKGNWGILSSTANKEARHKIIMESKIESKGEH